VQLDVDLSFTTMEWDRYHDVQRVMNHIAADLELDPTKEVPNPQESTVNYGGSGIAVDVMVDSGSYALAISPALAKELLEGTQGEHYTQSSLFFESDRAAQSAQAALREAGYLGVPSSSTYADAYDIFSDMIEGALMWVLWGMLVLFLTIFIALCSTRAMAAKRGDLAILRSMGIPNRVIKLSGYAQTALALIPAMLLLALTAVLCYRSPLINPHISFLHAPQYVMILVGMLALSALVTHWHNKRMFRDSVRKTLRGGEQK
jgi:ABC-type lipoprotein release transport system permease subunit